VTIDVVRQRLRNQRLESSDLRTPADPGEVVAWLGAMQAQDFAGAKWALGMRVPGITDAGVERAFDAGRILRTHLLRPTWHFVAPADIRWMLALTAPRVHGMNAAYYRKCGLDAPLFSRSAAVIERALEGGRQLTRSELASALRRAGIHADGMRLAYLMMRAELDGIMCSGPRRGKQFTYALVAERAPRARLLERDEALAELTRRYFSSHGPATLRDYSWWSGLTMREARAGVDMVRKTLAQEEIDGRTYWLVPPKTGRRRRAVPVYLLPNYDEYLIAYKDRDWVLEPLPVTRRGAVEHPHHLILDGKVRGSWKRMPGTTATTIEVRPFRPLQKNEGFALAAAAARYGRFLDRPVTVSCR
jgi:winged helix DNA-binding protein